MTTFSHKCPSSSSFVRNLPSRHSKSKMLTMCFRARDLSPLQNSPLPTLPPSLCGVSIIVSSSNQTHVSVPGPHNDLHLAIKSRDETTPAVAVDSLTPLRNLLFIMREGFPKGKREG